MSRDWYIDSFGMPLSTQYAAADIYDKLIDQGWFSGRAKVPEPDLGWTRGEQSKTERSLENSHEPSRDQDRGIDR